MILDDRPPAQPCSRIRGSISLFAMAIAMAAVQANAQDRNGTPQALALNVAQNVPAGFEGLDDTVETVFDIYVSGRIVGTAPVRIADGKATFLNPAVVASMLPARIDRQKVIDLLSTDLPTNEHLRCLPGRTADCGFLPPQQAGVIVNPERFSLELFLTADFYLEGSEEDLYLSDPVSGPSLIQTALVSFSAGDGGGGVNFGATLDTLASIGRTSLVAQTLVRDEGANLQRAYLQHFWQKRSAAAGFLQPASTVSFTNYRTLGAEYGSFFGARRDISDGLQTPLEVVVPRAGQVEVFRDGVLIHASRMEAGLQRINTINFPAGSYQVRIVVRDGDQIIADENRIFTKTTDLPPEGEWAYRIRAGLRVSDFDSVGFGTGISSSRDRSFLPHVTNEPLASVSATRRISPGIGLGGEILAVNDTVYAEGSAIAYLGRVKGVAAAAAGTDGAYSFLLNSNAQIGRFNINLLGRHARLKDDFIGPRDDEFRPFFRSEDTVQAGLSFDVAGGNLSISGSYSRTPGFRDRHIISARYSRSLNVGSMGAARLAAFALKSNDDLRVGVTLTFLKRIDRKTVVTYGGGGEYRSQQDTTPNREGFYPVVEAQISRQDRLGSIDLNNQAGISTDSERHRAFVSTTAVSNYGTLDLTGDYEDRRGGGSGGDFGLSGNLFTGIVVGGGKVQWGIRQPGGDAALLVNVERPEADRDTNLRDQGRYRILLGNQFVGAVEPGSSATLIAQSFREYRVGLQPEGSPPYTIDLAARRVPLYPGNVAVVNYSMSRVVAIFGRLLDAERRPIAGARISGKGDTTVTDDNGYFVYSATSDDKIDFFDGSDRICHSTLLADVLKARSGDDRQDYLKLGDILCAPDAEPQPSTGTEKADKAPVGAPGVERGAGSPAVARTEPTPTDADTEQLVSCLQAEAVLRSLSRLDETCRILGKSDG